MPLPQAMSKPTERGRREDSCTGDKTRARLLQNLQRLWFSLRRRLYARHDTKQPEERPPRAVLGASFAQRLPERRRRVKR